MLTSIPFSIAAGTVLGFLTGLGTGGGSLLILWLTFVAGMDVQQAQLVNLMFFFPSALTATILNRKRNRVQWKKILIPALAGSAAALVFSILGQKMNTESLQKLFGVLLLYTGMRELFYRPRKPR
jgi:uncharacterized membrane protein YfcA